MSDMVELTDHIPPPQDRRRDSEDIVLYGVDLDPPTAPVPVDQVRPQSALAYGFCYQGHCYRLSMPAEYRFDGANSREAVGCGYNTVPGYRMWYLGKTLPVTRVEKRKGTAEELILEFNLPGRSPATLTYSAKGLIASKAGKIYE